MQNKGKFIRRKSKKNFKKKTQNPTIIGHIEKKLPGGRFEIKVQTREGVEPVILNNIRVSNKLRRLKLVIGDKVKVEFDPEAGLTDSASTQITEIIRENYVPRNSKPNSNFKHRR